MSFIDSALNFASEIARFVPVYGPAISAGIDLAREAWNIVQPMASDVASMTASELTRDWPAQQQNWVNHAVDGVFG